MFDKLPDDLQYLIWKSYFSNHVLKEVKNHGGWWDLETQPDGVLVKLDIHTDLEAEWNFKNQ